MIQLAVLIDAATAEVDTDQISSKKSAVFPLGSRSRVDLVEKNSVDDLVVIEVRNLINPRV